MKNEYQELESKALQSLKDIIEKFPSKEEVIPETLDKINEYDKVISKEKYDDNYSINSK